MWFLVLSAECSSTRRVGLLDQAAEHVAARDVPRKTESITREPREVPRAICATDTNTNINTNISTSTKLSLETVETRVAKATSVRL